LAVVEESVQHKPCDLCCYRLVGSWHFKEYWKELPVVVQLNTFNRLNQSACLWTC
jgi:hypothetical protein